MVPKARIDVHQHIVPPFWRDALLKDNGDPFRKIAHEWSPLQAIEFMDSQSISTGILSWSTASVITAGAQERLDVVRNVNEYAADLVLKHPDRFGYFASLPVPDIDASIKEISYAFDVLKADGIVLLSNYAGQYLGDTAFDPIWHELNRRAAVVFIHPNDPLIPMINGIPTPLVDYPFDTTRTAVDMVFNGVMDRYRDIKVILAHAGGFLPYASYRFAEAGALACQHHPAARDVLEALRRFYFDLALSSSPVALSALHAFTGSRNIIYGSDYPYAPASIGASFARELDDYKFLDDDEHRLINHGNALELFPRLRTFFESGSIYSSST